MKKFKLIKTYPSSPELGHIIITNDYIKYPFTEYRSAEKYPEFWEEIVEKDYEILSFKGDNIVNVLLKRLPGTEKWAKNPNNTDLFTTISYTLKAILENNFYSIHSIKRLSDGEVFTIGDTTNGGIILSFDIWKCPKNMPFTIFEDTLQINVNKDDDYWEIKQLKHIKKPLFTTEDFVDIFTDDTFYFITSSNWKIGTVKASLDVVANNALARFTTKKAAEKYIIMNKPCLSLKDVGNFYKSAPNGRSKTSKGLIDLVKCKL